MVGENFPTLTEEFQDVLQSPKKDKHKSHFILKLKIKDRKKCLIAEAAKAKQRKNNQMDNYFLRRNEESQKTTERSL